MPGDVVCIHLRSHGDRMGKRYRNTVILIVDGDIADDLRDTIVQEESWGMRGTVGVVADELEVSLRRPEAARPYAERVDETQVAAALLAAGKGRSSSPVPGSASFHVSGCSCCCRN